jgi:gliding motility-associated-like protein
MRHLFLILFCFYCKFAVSDGCSSVSFTATASPNLLCSVDFQGLSVQNTDCDYSQPYDFYWDFGDGSPIVYTTMNPSHQYQASGVYNVTFTWEGICHGGPTICFTTQQVQITLPPPPPITSVVSDYNGYNVSCYGANDGSITLNSIGAYTYEWQTSPIQYGNTVNNLFAGPVDVLAILNGCPTQPIPFNLSEPTEILSTINSSSNYNGYDLRCFGDSDAVINLNVSGSVPPYLYQWNNGNTSQNLSNLSAGLYSVTITDANNCESTNSIELIEPDELESIPTNSKDSCGRGVANAEVEILGGVQLYEYLWSNNETTPLVTNLYEGNYNVLVTDANNCSISEQIIIENVPDPIVDFNIVPSLNLHHFSEQMDNPILFIDESQDDFTIIIEWLWEFEDGFTTDLQNTEHSFSEVGDFDVSLIIRNLFGCLDTIKKRVIVEDFLLYIPNSFTPDGDGINELFSPKGMGVKKYKLDIFDRWGERIFTSNHLRGNEEYCSHTQQDVIGWNGTLDNSERIAQLGVYMYLINLEDVFGMPHQYMGQVTLIR